MEDFRIKGGDQIPDVQLKFKNKLPILDIDFTHITTFSEDVLIGLVDCVEAWTDLRERPITINCISKKMVSDDFTSPLIKRMAYKKHVEIVHHHK